MTDKPDTSPTLEQLIKTMADADRGPATNLAEEFAEILGDGMELAVAGATMMVDEMAISAILINAGITTFAQLSEARQIASVAVKAVLREVVAEAEAKLAAEMDDE